MPGFALMPQDVAAIVPLFLESADTAWQTEQGLERMLDLPHRLVASGLPTLVVGNSPEICHRAEEDGLRTLCLDVPTPADGGFASLVRELAQSLRAELPDTATAVFINFRKPMLAGQTLMKALQAFAACENKRLVSVTTPEDHPCQAVLGHVLHDAGMIHLVDDSFCAPFGLEGRYFSRPCPRDWVVDAPLVQRDVGLLGHVHTTVAQEQGGTMWLRDEQGLARLVFPTDMTAPGGGNADGLNRMTTACVQPQGTSLAISFDHPVLCEEDSTTRLCLSAFAADGSSLGEPLHFRFEAGPAQAVVEAQPEVVGYLFFLYAESQVNSDFDIRFVPEDAPWSVDRQNRIHNKAQGLLMQGRQQFPEVYEEDDSLLIVDWSGGGGDESDDGGVWSGEPYPFIVASEEAITVRDEIDQLRLKAHLRANGGGHE